MKKIKLKDLKSAIKKQVKKLKENFELEASNSEATVNVKVVEAVLEEISDYTELLLGRIQDVDVNNVTPEQLDILQRAAMHLENADLELEKGGFTYLDFQGSVIPKTS